MNNYSNTEIRIGRAISCGFALFAAIAVFAIVNMI